MATETAEFDLRLYKADAVTTAMEAFEDFATFEVDKGDKAIAVTATLRDETARLVWGEFTNYVLVNS